MKRILFLIIILFLFSGIASGYELGAGSGTSYPDAIDTDTSIEVDYPDPLATTARAAVPNDTNAAVIAIETELGINPSGEYATVKARLDAGIGDLSFTDLDDTPASYTGQAGKYTKVNAGETALEFGIPAGYTNLTSFVEQTAWRLFYSNAEGDVIELPLGADGTYLGSNGVAVAPSFGTPTGAGDMLKATYDTDTDNIVDKAEIVDDGVGNSSTAADVKDAVTKRHSQNTDTDLDATFEATFVKKTDTINVLSDITSAGADIEDAVTKKHTAGTDTTLGTLTADVNMGTHKLTGLSVPSAVGESVRTTATITEANLEDAISKKHTQNTDTQFDFYNALTNDHDWSGDKDTQLVGENVEFGDILYKDWNAGEWLKAKADAFATTPGLRIALETKGDGQACLMLVKGYIRDDSAFDFGASRVFLNDDVAGTCDDTAPAESGDQIQMIGIAISADILWFDPSIDVGEI